MQRDRIARSIASFLLAAVLVLGASSLLAAEPTGDSPFDGLTVTCQVKSLARSGKTWFKIPYHKGMELEVDLTAIDGVYFDVFAPDQVKDWPTVGRAIGTSAPNPNDPVYLKTWQGHLEQSDYVLDFYYVHLTNRLGFEVSYQLCSQESASAIVEPTGDSPAHGLTAAPCVLQFLNPNAQIWHKVPYHSGIELELYMKAASAEVNFDVFTPEQVRSWPTLGQPIGRGTANRNEPEYGKSWQGHLLDSDYYYVLVTNTKRVQVQYQLCVIENELLGPPASPTPLLPTRTPRPRPGT